MTQMREDDVAIVAGHGMVEREWPLDGAQRISESPVFASAQA
jgi:hypothetical protein